MMVQLQDDVQGPNTTPTQTAQHISNRNLDVVFGSVLYLCANEDEHWWWTWTGINHRGGKDTWGRAFQTYRSHQIDGKCKDKWHRHWRTNQPWSWCSFRSEARLAGGWAVIDWVWRLSISYQLYMWGRALRFRHGLLNESVLPSSCRDWL